MARGLPLGSELLRSYCRARALAPRRCMPAVGTHSNGQNSGVHARIQTIRGAGLRGWDTRFEWRADDLLSLTGCRTIVASRWPCGSIGAQTKGPGRNRQIARAGEAQAWLAMRKAVRTARQAYRTGRARWCSPVARRCSIRLFRRVRNAAPVGGRQGVGCGADVPRAGGCTGEIMWMEAGLTGTTNGSHHGIDHIHRCCRCFPKNIVGCIGRCQRNQLRGSRVLEEEPLAAQVDSD